MSATKVLIADGDGDSRAVYRIMLAHSGYEVLEADNGEAALARARAGGVSVVVTELTLQTMDGHTLLETLKSDPRTADICVIVLTARVLETDRARAEGAGCAVFLTKPLEPQALVRAVSEALEMRR